MRKQKLVTGNIYHVYNRGVEKRKIFSNDRDYKRFLRNLVIFNDTKPAINSKYKVREIESKSKHRECLVDVLAFCLMPNHFHLLIKQKIDDGITKFMRKIGDGYVKYFNLKYERVGPLFQGKFKSVLIDNNRQLLYMPHYIHLNSLDLKFPDWREKGIKDIKKALNFLDSYKWSSYREYTSNHSDPTLILNMNVLDEYFDNAEEYKKDIIGFINGIEVSEISDLLLE